MSGTVNKAILIGDCTRDPEVRALQDGSKVVNISLATHETWKDKATSERKEKAEFHRIVIFNERLAEVAEKYIHKGSKVYVEGQIQTQKWINKDGNERHTTEIVLQRSRGALTLLDSKADGEPTQKEIPWT